MTAAGALPVNVAAGLVAADTDAAEGGGDALAGAGLDNADAVCVERGGVDAAEVTLAGAEAGDAAGGAA